MLEQVRRTIVTHGLLRGGERVIIGFSGGIDSVCLTHVLKSLNELNLELWAVYIDYGLRPAENRREEALLQEYGARLGIKTVRFGVNIPERLQQKNDSVQLVAREERYRIFRNFGAEIGADKIALAHHRDDQAETIFYRLVRGTGIDGLAGMPIQRGDLFIRPLLEVSRDEIRQYVQANNLSWVEDSSNQKLIYRRNQIRHRLIPEIEVKLNPRFKEALLRLSLLAGEQQEMMASLAAQEAVAIFRMEPDRIGLRLAPFAKLPKYLQYYLLKLAYGKLYPGANLESVSLLKIRDRIDAANASGCVAARAMHLWKGLSLYFEDNCAFLGKIPDRSLPSDRVYQLTVPGSVAILEAGLRLTVERAETPPNWCNVTKQEAYFNCVVPQLPFRVRFWQPGDWFWPLGAAGTQKLQDYFVNCKVPRRKRNAIPLLEDAAGRIIWIAGHRLDERFKLKEGDREAWHVSMAPGVGINGGTKSEE